MTGALELRIRGPVTQCICRTTTAGSPLLEVHITDTASGQQVRAMHAYPNGTPATHYAAAAMARSLRGQVAELDAINPRFHARRLDCEAIHISLQYPQQTRKDLE